MAGLEGKTLDHYELQRLIGRGGMADVYEAYDRYFQREVAVKVFKREDDELLRRFIREANLMASLKNEHLVPIYGSGEYQLDGLTQYYIVMPFMQGGTLRARIRYAPLTLAQACECLQEVAPALDYIHSQNIVHRDIKASNVLLDADGRYYLSDFGIARMTADVTQLTSTGNVLGTVDYIAPELFEGNHKANALSDLYSLGVLLFEMVTGRLPFQADNQIAVVTMHINKPPPSPRSLNPHISPQVERVILKALEKKPERRYQSAIELANAFCLAIAASDMEETQEDIPGSTVAPAPRTASERITPLIVQPPPTPILPEMPPITSLSKVVSSRPIESRPIERTQKQRRRRASPASQRTVVVTILALVILLVLAIPTFLVATHRLNPNNAFTTTPVQTATTPAATQGTTSAPITTTATPDLTATAQAAASATAQAQDQATVTAQAAASATAQAQDQATATAQADASATAQAQDQATATVVAGVTATAQAQAQATAGIVQTATAGAPTYQDPLTDATNPDTVAANWDKNNHCMFMSDGYHVTEPVGIVNLHGCRESANMYGNLAILVDVSIISGHSAGVFFRVSTDVLNTYTGGYLFEIDSQGDYRISGFNGSVQPLHDWTSSSALKQGNNVTNTLLAVAQGGKLLFYANGVFLTEVDDSTYTSGVIAFLATTTDTNADVVYSNLKVYQLS